MTHDLLQNYAMWGAYSGVPTLQPFTQQNYGQYPVGLNPLAQHSLAHQLHLASILAGQTNPQLQAISPFQQGQYNPFIGWQQNPVALYNPYLAQNPFALQNPWIAAQNPLIAATLQNPMLNPLLTQGIGGQSPYQQQGGGYGPQFGQQGTPFGQTGYPLAPQSWIGQGAQTGQIHPLYQQLAAARAYTPGGIPFTGF